MVLSDLARLGRLPPRQAARQRSKTFLDQDFPHRWAGVSHCRLWGSGTLLVTWPDGEDGPVPSEHHSTGMNQNFVTSPVSDIRLASAAVIDGVWIVEAHNLSTSAACPRCQVVSSARHSSYQRRLWDLPIQGRPVRVTLTVGRWQCRNAECGQSIFTERLPGMVGPRARQTRRAAGILRLLGHGVGGRPGERLAARLGFAGAPRGRHDDHC
jgi:zinc-finger of transposase IS204/IS1001/IS1096/IS1165